MRDKRLSTLLAPLGVLLTLLTLTLVGPARALPPGGPGPETPGTTSRVWPTNVGPGGVLHFEVAGYPANETVYIKIDDGNMCSDTSHGACVYHTQKLDSKGYAKGSIVLPADIANGAHWLRMLATGDVFDDDGNKIGYTGYTRRGGNDFTVVPGGVTDGSGAPTVALADVSGPAQGTDTKGGSGGASGGAVATVEGGTIELDAAGEGGEGEEDGASDDTKDAAQVVPYEKSGGLPTVGIAAVGGALLLGAGFIGWALLHRRKAMAAAAAAAAPAAAE
ncbi:MAG: hypothetical protein QM621_09955 [Aeromicrobium sp.]|uniref:hypothetical protein n=1 Tax=Aeromicrobium sp. TaxID=1871063 RepID=UPI0039E3E807